MRGSFKFKLDWSTAAGPICLNPDQPPCLSLSLPNDFCPARNVTETMGDGISAASAREANCLPPVPLIGRYIGGGGGFGEKIRVRRSGRPPSVLPFLLKTHHASRSESGRFLGGNVGTAEYSRFSHTLPNSRSNFGKKDPAQRFLEKPLGAIREFRLCPSCPREMR